MVEIGATDVAFRTLVVDGILAPHALDSDLGPSKPVAPICRTSRMRSTRLTCPSQYSRNSMNSSRRSTPHFSPAPACAIRLASNRTQIDTICIYLHDPSTFYSGGDRTSRSIASPEPVIAPAFRRPCDGPGSRILPLPVCLTGLDLAAACSPHCSRVASRLYCPPAGLIGL